MDDLKIKVCGMTDPSNVEEICKLKPDYLGYIFYPKSARFVGDNPDPSLFSLVPEDIFKTAVFVNEYLEKMIEVMGKYTIQAVQLHGMESPEVCSLLRARGFLVIKVIPSDQLSNRKLLFEYSEVVDYFLFDTSAISYGGSGRKFDWSKLNELQSDLQYFLSGGIAPEDVCQLKSIKSLNLYAADINSRFETEPGIKNPALVKNFIKEIRDGK